MEEEKNEALIEIKNLSKSFGDKVVLDGVNLKIAPHSIFSILGKSGTGKSVLIKCLIQLLKADQGEIWYKGRDLEKTNKKQRKIINKDFAYLFQESALFDSLSVKDNISFPIKEVLGIHDQKYIDKRVTELLNWVNLPNTENLMPSELSGGMKKRTSFARTLAMSPKIMLCDEPTTGLDPVTGKTIMDLIIRANKEFGITCIIITHDVPAAFRVSDTLAFLDAGKIRAIGNKDEFLEEDYPLLYDFINNSFVSKDELFGDKE